MNIKELPEIYDNSKNCAFHNLFYERYLDDNKDKKYCASTYYGTFSELQRSGTVDRYSRRPPSPPIQSCNLLRDWVECYNANQSITLTKKLLIYVETAQTCSIVVLNR
jgi:hypothetical protein